MLKLVKNFIANIPLILTLPLQVLVKIFNKICMFAIAASSFLHVLLKTDTGKQLKLLELKIRKAESIAKKQKQGAPAGANPRLKQIISGDSNGQTTPKI